MVFAAPDNVIYTQTESGRLANRESKQFIGERDYSYRNMDTSALLIGDFQNRFAGDQKFWYPTSNAFHTFITAKTGEIYVNRCRLVMRNFGCEETVIVPYICILKDRLRKSRCSPTVYINQKLKLKDWSRGRLVEIKARIQ